MSAKRPGAAALALATVLACCHGEPTPAPKTSPAAARAAATCRVGPDGAPVLADRGIGGTGGPIVMADRGIGGTGIDAIDTNKSRSVSTGIVGVITGFASICLAGQEVALPPDVSVAIEAKPASPDALRAGQVAVVAAADAPAGLSARRIVIRYEVIGPVERLDHGRADNDRLRVAGQDVQLSPQTWGPRPALGEWVAVSGLRRADGVIEATRVEPRAPGQIVIHGTLTEQQGDLRIGALPVRRDPATTALVNQQITLTGVIGRSGQMLPLSVTPDLLAVDPAAFFGPAVGVVFIESFAVLDGGRLRLAPGFSAPAPNLHLDCNQRGVFRFERVDGRLRAVGRADSQAGFGPAARFQPAPRYEPAPVPNRAIRAPGSGPQGRDRSGFGRGGGRRGRYDRQRDDSPPGFGAPTNRGPFAPAGGDADDSASPRVGPPHGR